MEFDELVVWARQLKAALDNPKLCPRKRAVIEQQFVKACKEIAEKRKSSDEIPS